MFEGSGSEYMTDEEVMSLFNEDCQGLEVMIALGEVTPVANNPRRFVRQAVMSYKAELDRRLRAFQELRELLEEDRASSNY